MKTRLLKYCAAFFAVFLILAPVTVAVTGCSTPAQQTAKQIQSVPEIMAGWADYVVAERARIDALPKSDQGEGKADLLRAEGRVFNAYRDYQLVAADLHAQPTPAAYVKLEAAVKNLITVINTEKH